MWATVHVNKHIYTKNMLLMWAKRGEKPVPSDDDDDDRPTLPTATTSSDELNRLDRFWFDVFCAFFLSMRDE